MSTPRVYSVLRTGIPLAVDRWRKLDFSLYRKDDREYFKKGLEIAVRHLTPTHIIVYGAAPDDIFGDYKEKGISITTFESEFSKTRRQVKA